MFLVFIFKYNHWNLHKKFVVNDIFTIFHKSSYVSLNIGPIISNRHALEYLSRSLTTCIPLYYGGPEVQTMFSLAGGTGLGFVLLGPPTYVLKDCQVEN